MFKLTPVPDPADPALLEFPPRPPCPFDPLPERLTGLLPRSVPDNLVPQPVVAPLEEPMPLAFHGLHEQV